MTGLAHTTRPLTPAARPWQALLALVRELARRSALRREYARARYEFERLDAATLRDIGMRRSEFGSFWAESHGLVEPTRARLLHAMARQNPH